MLGTLDELCLFSDLELAVYGPQQDVEAHEHDRADVRLDASIENAGDHASDLALDLAQVGRTGAATTTAAPASLGALAALFLQVWVVCCAPLRTTDRHTPATLAIRLDCAAFTY